MDDVQRAVVDHGDGPARVVGTFGSGVSTALAARAERLRGEGRAVLETTPAALPSFATGLLGGRRLLTHVEQRARVAELGGDDETASIVLAYQASFLGREELLVHAEAAGELDRWEALDALTTRYLAALDQAGEVDEAGAVVAASLLLRDEAVLAPVRPDDIVVDDYQTATFAIARLLSQLASRGGNIVVGGNPLASFSDEQGPAGVSARHLERFARHMGATVDLSLTETRRRPANVRVERDAVVATLAANGAMVIGRDSVPVSGEWPRVVIAEATDGRWPAPRPVHRRYDPWLLAGPDVPDDAARDAAWLESERNRFFTACTRATDELIVVAREPTSPFVADLEAFWV